MDQGIGEVLGALQKNGLAKNTLVWFFSDNGANAKGNNGGLKGFKGSVWEGGHRVPSVAYWPGKIKPGSVTNQLSITLDVFPTIVSIAKASDSNIPPLDGIDLSKTLLNAEITLANRTLFWGFGKQRAARKGKWKLVANAKGQKGGPALFDLAKDRGEKTNRASSQGKKVKEMLDAIKAWDEEVGPSSFAKTE